MIPSESSLSTTPDAGEIGVENDSPKGTPKRPLILVIDDVSMSLKLAVRVLRWEGYRVIQAPDAESGLPLILDYRPDLVVLDVKLSRMDGISLVRLLRKDERTRLLPVIAYTSYDRKDEILAIIEAGFTDYLSKPIDTRSFCKLISRYVSRPVNTSISLDS